MITPDLTQPIHENLRRQSIARERLEQRAKRTEATSTSLEDIAVEETMYCFGAGSICEQSNNLYAQCQKQYPAGSDSDPMKYYVNITTCECGEGYAAADEALVYL